MPKSVAECVGIPCSACGACAAVCPTGAIVLKQDDMGFLRAEVDAKGCVSCGLCESICPKLQDGIGSSLHATKVYAVQSTDSDTVCRSASGGIAHELAVLALKSGASAVGAVYDLKTDRVEHRIVSDEADIALLDGSKYLQSNTSPAFGEVLDTLRADKSARFAVFGLPCQIAGMSLAAKRLGVRDRLLLTELFCHGVPSYKLWEAQCGMMHEKLGARPFDALSFRDKSQGWHNYRLTARSGDKTFAATRERGLFWNAYFEDMLLGDACVVCRERKESSEADLRIGDCWGRRFQSRTDGVSVVFALTEHGAAAVDELVCGKRLVLLEGMDADEALAYQNMAGYKENKAHDDALGMLRGGTDVFTVIKHYRKKQSPKQKLKRALLRLSGVLPVKLRIKLKGFRRT